MIKIIHTADLHLDSPFSMLDLQKSDMRRHEIRASFDSLISLTKSSRADILIISGDLFESSFVTLETLSMVKSGFEAIPDCRIVIAPGNHDPAGENSVYKRITLPDNVYLFESEKISHFDFPEINCTVYGYAFTEPHMDNSPLCAGFPVDSSRINIVAAHADLTSLTARKAAVTAKDLERLDVDYIALGHIHNSTGVHTLRNGGFYAYSGCLEGRGFDETGEKGVISAEIDKSDGKLVFEHRFISLSKRLYLTRTIDVTGCESNLEILTKINSFIKEENLGERHALKLILEGMLEPSLRVFTHYLRDQINSLFTIKIVDTTLPLLDRNSLEADPSIRGAFFDKLRPLLESDDPDERELASMALRYGLTALAGGETADFT